MARIDDSATPFVHVGIGHVKRVERATCTFPVAPAKFVAARAVKGEKVNCVVIFEIEGSPRHICKEAARAVKGSSLAHYSLKAEGGSAFTIEILTAKLEVKRGDADILKP